MNTYLKSFTILETLTNLIIIGIIISMSYTFFNLFNSQLLLLNQQASTDTSYNLFHNTLLNDINSSNFFIKKNNSFILKSYTKHTIIYNVTPKYILRKSLLNTDTFKIKTTNFLVEETSRLKITVELFNQKIDLYYSLNNSPENIINNKFFK